MAVVLAVTPTPTSTDLDQTLDPGQAQATGRAVLDQGHVDIGPRLRDGKWSIQIHDDHAEPSVWREPAETVFRVNDTAVQQIPDDPNYAFLGAKPGTKVHVIPQTEQQGLVWVGWNTQDPGVLGAISRGAALNLRGVQGPGDVAVFLQSGNFGAPQVLWTTSKPFPQPLWVETNTHTHANWVFSRPGTYLLALDVTADLADGSAATASAVLRFAVGDATDPDDAFNATFDGPLPSASASPTPLTQKSDSSGTGSALLFVAIAIAVAVLVVVALVLRQSRVRRRAEQQREAGR